MIDINPTFTQTFVNISNGLPEGFNTNLSIPFLTKNGKNIKVTYKDRILTEFSISGRII